MHTAFAGADINRDTLQFLTERSWRRTVDTAFAAADINRNWYALQVSLHIAFRGQEGSCECSQVSDDGCAWEKVERTTQY